MEPFITFRDKNNSGELCYYILQREFPHYIGLISETPNLKALACVPITSHNLWVIHNGVLAGNYIPAQRDVMDEIKKVFQGMSDWYYAHRVIPNPKKYKKLAI